MKALVIAQPTKRKRPGPAPAWELYQGSQQQLVQQGLQAVWNRFGFRQLIDEVILSPLHGPVTPDQVLEPYNYTWKGRPRPEVAAQVAEAAIVERLQAAVQGCDLVLVLLSRVYLAPLQLPRWVPGTAPQRWLFFISSEGLPFAPVGPGVRYVPAGTAEARRERVKVLDLKAHLFRQLCFRATEQGAAALDDAWAAAGISGAGTVSSSKLTQKE
ncbi:MAG TPA: hypothetical protein VNT01_08735 [Symbiobacteriaceae bacterium]|nr:hypothetical protein [Symbiobacteriaceae bacterium]